MGRVWRSMGEVGSAGLLHPEGHFMDPKAGKLREGVFKRLRRHWGEFIEVQGTGEESTFTRAELNQLLDLAENSIKKLIELQDRIINQEDLKIFLATANKHKIEEISDIFSGIENIEILSIKDGIEIPEVIEDGDTFEANSKKKAVEIANFLNMITIADDSGLCVDALNGEPGVYSARYSGTGDDLKNNEKLINNLKGIENCSRSMSLLSITRSPTAWCSLKVPDCFKSSSTIVVLP